MIPSCDKGLELQSDLMHFCFVFLWLLEPLFPDRTPTHWTMAKTRLTQSCQRFSADSELGVEARPGPVRMLVGLCGEHAGSGQLIGEGGSHGWSRAGPRVPGSGYPICPCLGGSPCGCPAVLDRASPLTLESSLFGKGLLTDGGCTVLEVVLWVDGGMGWALGKEGGRGRLGPGGHCTHNTASSLPPSFQFLVIAGLADPHPPGARKVGVPAHPVHSQAGPQGWALERRAADES